MGLNYTSYPIYYALDWRKINVHPQYQLSKTCNKRFLDWRHNYIIVIILHYRTCVNKSLKHAAFDGLSHWSISLNLKIMI